MSHLGPSRPSPALAVPPRPRPRSRLRRTSAPPPAFADAGVRFSRAAEAVDELDDRPYRKCRPLVRSVSEDNQLELAYLQILTEFRLVADSLREPLRQLRTDLANAQTRDPVLLSGRAAWRQAGRAMAALPVAEDPCPAARLAPSGLSALGAPRDAEGDNPGDRRPSHVAPAAAARSRRRDLTRPPRTRWHMPAATEASFAALAERNP